MKESIRNTHYFLSFFPLFLQIKKSVFFVKTSENRYVKEKYFSKKGFTYGRITQDVSITRTGINSLWITISYKQNRSHIRGNWAGWIVLTEFFSKRGMKFMELSTMVLRLILNASIIYIRMPHSNRVRFILHYGDLADSACIAKLVNEIIPDEVYNLGVHKATYGFLLIFQNIQPILMLLALYVF